MTKFDSSVEATILDLPMASQDGSFFGPFKAKNTMIFISLTNPVKYDIDKWEYEEHGEIIEKGHIFALFSVEDQDTKILSTNENEAKPHYRLKKNLGSVLKNANFGGVLNDNVIKLDYDEGDYCENGKRYQTTIRLVCDMNSTFEEQFIYLQSDSSICNYEFIWRTPFACSQCRLNETTKYYVFL